MDDKCKVNDLIEMLKKLTLKENQETLNNKFCFD